MNRRSLSLKTDSVFRETDEQLAERLRSLLSWLSVGEMKTVANDMLRRFLSGSGKTYENEILNREVQKTLPSANITRILSMILIALSSETITTQTESTLQFR